MTGRTCLVTGATSGIGTATARELARAGAHVVAVGRDPAKLDRTLEDLRRTSGSDRVEGLRADLSVLAQVQGLADQFKARHDRLDVLVNNAGAAYTERQESADGLELTFALNHMGYFVLTEGLRDVLVASGASRVVNVSSRAHYRGHMDFDDLQGERSYGAIQAYAQSKLANVLFTSALARRLQGTKVCTNSLHPGVVATSIGQNNGWKGVLIGWFFRWFGISVEEGARTTVYLAGSTEVEGVTGKYFDRCRAVTPSKEAQDETVAERLWQVSEDLLRSCTHGPTRS